MTPTNTPLPDLSGLKKVAQHAIPARIGGDRPSADPGGCDCQLCGELFVGDVMHTTCEGCEASEAFRRAFTPEIALALIAKVEGLEKEEGAAVSAAERAFVRHLIREMRATIVANPEAPTITTGPLDPDILERVLNVALASQGVDL